jgi:hypothetical protein
MLSNSTSVLIPCRYRNLSRDELLSQRWTPEKFKAAELKAKEDDAWTNAGQLAEAVNGAPCMGTFVQAQTADREHEALFQDREHLLWYLGAPARLQKLLPGALYYGRCREFFDQNSFVGFKSSFVEFRLPSSSLPAFLLPRPNFLFSSASARPVEKIVAPISVRPYRLVVSVAESDPSKAIQLYRQYQVPGTGACLSLSLLCLLDSSFLLYPVGLDSLAVHEIDREHEKSSVLGLKQLVADELNNHSSDVRANIMDFLLVKDGQTAAEALHQFVLGLSNYSRFEGEELIKCVCKLKQRSIHVSRFFEDRSDQNRIVTMSTPYGMDGHARGDVLFQDKKTDQGYVNGHYSPLVLTSRSEEPSEQLAAIKMYCAHMEPEGESRLSSSPPPVFEEYCRTADKYSAKFGYDETFLNQAPRDFFNPLRQVHAMYQAHKKTFFSEWYDVLRHEAEKERFFNVPPITTGLTSHRLVDELVSKFCGTCVFI